jgi:His/Glu/Gln/Arg/opine family amino acid ABC transporter permease subunit
MFNGFLPQILAGTWVTIQIASCSLVLGLALGLIGAAGESSRLRFIRYFFIAITSVIRGLPELLILFFIYFGGTILLTQMMGHYIDVNAFVAGVVALGIVFGAYASQTFRGAFLAVPSGQIEAAKALGLSGWRIFKRIYLPQAWRHALPGLGNLWLVILKDTSLVSLIGLADLMSRTQIASSTTHKPFVFYATAALIYLLLTSISQKILTVFTNKAQRHLG